MVVYKNKYKKVYNIFIGEMKAAFNHNIFERRYFMSNNSGIYLENPTVYALDAEKIQTIDDIKAILKRLDIVFYDKELIKGIEHLVKEK